MHECGRGWRYFPTRLTATPAYTESGLLLTIEYGVVLAWAAAEYYVAHAKMPPAIAHRPSPGARAR